MKSGRPSAYTKIIANKICLRIANGESLRSICADEKLPSRATVMLWVATDRNGFSDQYDKACRARAHFWADELLDIADDATNDWMQRFHADNWGWSVNGDAIQRSRLRVDTRKWLLSKMLPKYADKPEHLEDTTPPQPVSINFVIKDARTKDR